VRIIQPGSQKKEQGNKRCEHARLDREHRIDSQTGDYVCGVCGERFTPREATELRSRQREAREKRFFETYIEIID
jgi:hypothetical protein